nr:GtrA family protein [Martelella sp. HB161492]
MIVGGASTVINYCFFYVLFELAGTDYSLAFVVGFLAGLGFGYIFNKIWTFQVREASTLAVVSKYVAVYMVSLGLGIAFFRLLVEVFGLDPLLGNLITICLTTCTNFLGTRLLVFRAQP